MSEKRLLGWEPTETHDHAYDDEGRLVRTVVTREVEWDDQQRANMLALADWEADLCKCGLPTALADTDPNIEPKYRHCPSCANLAKFARYQHAADEAWVKESEENLGRALLPSEKRPTDGRVYMGFEFKDEGEPQVAAL